MDSKRTGAIRRWFEQLLKAKLGIDPVDGWALLYKRHISVITHLIITRKFKKCEEKSSQEAYTKAYHALVDQMTDASFLDHLKPDLAATGDNFEVAKFLIVFLNELRISFEVVFDEDYGLTEEENKHIGAVLRYLEDHQNWDPYESWPAVLFQNDDEPVDVKNCFTPKIRRSNHCGFVLSERADIRRSPLSEIVSSPRSRELRIIREKDRKIKTLSERCKQLEYEKDDLDGSLRTANQEIKKLAKSLSEIAGSMSEKDTRCQTLGTELDDWRTKAATAEEESNQLKQQLKTVKQELHTIQRQLREAEFDISSKQRAVESWEKSAALEEQWRLKMERERGELLQELEVTRISKAVAEERLLRLTTNDEAEITELRNIIDGLRSDIKEARRERDEALISQDERVRIKELEIAKYAGMIVEMKKQLSVARFSVRNIRSLAVQIRNLCKELENRRTEIQGLRFLFTAIQNGYQTLHEENSQNRTIIESLRNNIAICEYQSKALAASLEDQRKKHLEAMMAKQEILNGKERMLLERWNQLNSSVELNIRLQEELTRRDVAYHILEQRLASAEEKCSTISQRFSISNSTLDSKPAEEMTKINSHFSEAVDVSSGALLHEFHPLPEVEDENDLLSSSSMAGDPYVLTVEPQSGKLITADEQDEFNTSVDSERLSELNRRNRTLPPHMRSTYATELTYAAKRFPSDRLEDELKNSKDFTPYSHMSGGDTSSLVSPVNLSKTKYVSRSLRSVKKHFSKILQEANTSKTSITNKDRTPLKWKN
uniref:Calponin-homology (CH) domain-containing protein n=1 Tax=Elaeophora elaphi TaxID=1147741 RepID=A0A0R3S2P7_9BILA